MPGFCNNYTTSVMNLILPSTQAMHAFRDNETTLLLATPAASRGLDLPAVGFVYSLGAPADATDYLHRAGRAGRIGSPFNGAAASCARTQTGMVCAG